jgi:hypothetical protein
LSKKIFFPKRALPSKVSLLGEIEEGVTSSFLQDIKVTVITKTKMVNFFIMVKNFH